MEIRKATSHDLHGIDKIYNQAIHARFQTGDLKPLEYEERLNWFNDHPPETYPIIVAVDSGNVIGYASISAYRKGREAFSKTIEISVYVDHLNLSKGIGTDLLIMAETISIEMGYKSAIAIVLERNTRSKSMFEKMGYERWGVLPSVAEFDDVEVDHIYFGKKLKG